MQVFGMMKWTIGAAMMVLLVGCAPDALTEDDVDVDREDVGQVDTAGDDGQEDASPDAGTPDAGEEPGEVTFSAVAEVVRSSCAFSNCHGASPRGEFGVEGGLDATDEQVRAALEGTTAENGKPLIDPGNPEGSEIYLRISTSNRNMMMPPTGALADEQIELVRRWIADGASYDE